MWQQTGNPGFTWTPQIGKFAPSSIWHTSNWLYKGSWSIRYIIRECDTECNNVIPPTPFTPLFNIFFALAFSPLLSLRLAIATKRRSVSWPQVLIGTTGLLNSFFVFVCSCLMSSVNRCCDWSEIKMVLHCYIPQVSCFSFDVSYTLVCHYFQFSFYALNFC